MSRLILVEAGGRGACTGCEVVDEIAAVLDDRLPTVPNDDPLRGHLLRFRSTLRPLRLAAGVLVDSDPVTSA